jgi:hypothetical protein
MARSQQDHLCLITPLMASTTAMIQATPITSGPTIPRTQHQCYGIGADPISRQERIDKDGTYGEAQGGSTPDNRDVMLGGELDAAEGAG